MSLPDIYRQGGGLVETPPQWLIEAAEAAYAAQAAFSDRQYIRIDTPADQLRVDPSDPERAVRVHWMPNPNYIPPEPEAA